MGGYFLKWYHLQEIFVHGRIQVLRLVHTERPYHHHHYIYGQHLWSFWWSLWWAEWVCIPIFVHQRNVTFLTESYGVNTPLEIMWSFLRITAWKWEKNWVEDASPVFSRILQDYVILYQDLLMPAIKDSSRLVTYGFVQNGISGLVTPKSDSCPQLFERKLFIV